jgi:hypothetical protein
VKQHQRTLLKTPQRDTASMYKPGTKKRASSFCLGVRRKNSVPSRTNTQFSAGFTSRITTWYGFHPRCSSKSLRPSWAHCVRSSAPAPCYSRRNLVLRQQIIVLQRSVPKPRIRKRDRQRKTGESYTAARLHVLQAQAELLGVAAEPAAPMASPACRRWSSKR